MTEVEAAIFGVAAELGPVEIPVEGESPPIGGRMYWNGPGRFQVGEDRRQHWLDGDGLVRCLDLSAGSGTATFRSRYVRTDRYVEETEADKMLYRAFGTAFPGDRLVGGWGLASPANVNVRLHAGRMLAYGEQSLPWELDPVTLETLGEFAFQETPGKAVPISAHPRVDPDSGEVMNFGITWFGHRARAAFTMFTPELATRARSYAHLPAGNYVHDISASRQFVCMHLGPYTLDAARFIREGDSFLDSLSWGEGPAQLLIVSRADATEVARIDIERPGFCLHQVNAYEDGDHLVVDLVDTPVPFFDRYFGARGMFTDIDPCFFVRYRINRSDWKVASTEVVPAGCHLDFPTFPSSWTGHQARDFWALSMPSGSGPKRFYDGVIHVQAGGGVAGRYQAPAGVHMGGEPIVAPATDGSDRLFLTCQELDLREHSSSYLTFDAHELESGPLARWRLPDIDPPAFHSTHVPS